MKSDYLKIPDYRKLEIQVLKSYKSERNHLMLNILYWSGLRVFELVKLTPRQQIYEESFLDIIGKRKKQREVHIPDGLNDLMKKYTMMNLLKLDQPFFHRTGKHQDSMISITTRAVEQFMKRNNFPNPHFFRHSFSVNTIKKTRNIKFLQDQLGHDDITTTLVYLKYISYKEEKKSINEMYQSSDLS